MVGTSFFNGGGGKMNFKEKLSDAHKGKKLSEEHKRHISESLRRKYNELRKVV